jgi:glycosyltransferase involved in cell wall biosynthesis
MNRLAIVIPAFKGAYFNQTLLSISRQSCKDFTLYIGNDSSPDNLQELVNKYRNQLNIVYKEFTDNLGGKDLVGQWERCIDLVDNEEWIWLFSDDDIMDPDCVERFYNTLELNPKFDIFHFNVSQIDVNDKIIRKLSTFPNLLTSEEFLLGRLNEKLYSFVVEYVFRKSHFISIGRFEQFDLAWGSDDATWIKLSKRNGIMNIDNARVYWRESPFNISPNNRDKILLERKFAAQIDFANWIIIESLKNNIQIEVNLLKHKLKLLFFKKIRDRIKYISFRMLSNIISQFHLVIYQEKHSFKEISFFYFYKIFLLLKETLQKVLFWKVLKFHIKKLLTCFC